MSAWRVLLAAALIVPPGAYVAGVLTSADAPETTRAPLRLPASAVADPGGMPTEPPTVLDPLPARPPSSTPSPAPGPRDCDDEDDTDDLDVIRPCPETVDDDDDDDDPDDDSADGPDDDRDDSDDGPDGDD